MKAIVYSKYGSPDVLKLTNVQKPEPGDDEVLIRIYATTVSSADCRMRKADPFAVRFLNGVARPNKITILGNELAGEIEATGKNVKQFRKGDQVYGQAGMTLGTNAEYICLPEEGALTIKPGNLTYEEAASIPFGGSSSLNFLNKGGIQSGQKVLIYGASGSLGTAAVQLARYFGTEVTGVCSTANIELVKSLGANKVIDYTRDDFSQSGESYDIIYDTVGKSPFADCVKSLTKNGVYLRAVHMSLSPMIRGAWTSLTSGKKVIGGVAEERKENLVILRELVETGKFIPVIDRRYPMEQIVEAHRYVDTGRKRGNVVLSV